MLLPVLQLVSLWCTGCLMECQGFVFILCFTYTSPAGLFLTRNSGEPWGESPQLTRRTGLPRVLSRGGRRRALTARTQDLLSPTCRWAKWARPISGDRIGRGSDDRGLPPVDLASQAGWSGADRLGEISWSAPFRSHGRLLLVRGDLPVSEGVVALPERLEDVVAAQHRRAHDLRPVLGQLIAFGAHD